MIEMESLQMECLPTCKQHTERTFVKRPRGSDLVVKKSAKENSFPGHVEGAHRDVSGDTIGQLIRGLHNSAIRGYDRLWI